MKPHPRIRKTIKWGGAVVTVLLVVLWIGSGMRYAEWCVGRNKFVVLWPGHVAIEWGLMLGTPGLSYHQTVWKPLPETWCFSYSSDFSGKSFTIPLGSPSVFAVLLTAAAWGLDSLARRHERNGCCPKCNYDRAGIAKDAVCPECGAADD